VPNSTSSSQHSVKPDKWLLTSFGVLLFQLKVQYQLPIISTIIIYQSYPTTAFSVTLCDGLVDSKTPGGPHFFTLLAFVAQNALFRQRRRLAATKNLKEKPTVKSVK
jgi:hypothetical protein